MVQDSDIVTVED